MSLSTRRRSSIFQKLIPVLGEEDADAFMAQFPATEHDQLVTRDHLRAELILTRTELRDELRGEMHVIRDELRGEMHVIRDELQLSRTEVHQHINRAMGAMTGVVLAAMGLLAAVL